MTPAFTNDHFSAVAAGYAEHRPHYPAALVDVLADRCTADAPLTAWDAGCGNGQLSVALATRFARVIATDPSASQIAEAVRHPLVDNTAPPFGVADGRGQAPAVDNTAPPFGVADGRRQAPAVDNTAPPFGVADGRGQAPAVDNTAPPFGVADGRGQAPAVDNTAPPFGVADGRGQAPAVEYRCEPAEASSVDAASVDLAVTAQAAHWFDFPRYLAEVARVTRPGAIVALVTYNVLHVDGDAGPIVDHYYHHVVHRYWPPERAHVENGYRDLALPWPAVDAPPLAMTARWTRAQLLGYVMTWSATTAMIKAIGRAPVDELGAALAAIWPDDDARPIRWPLIVKLARRP